MSSLSIIVATFGDEAWRGIAQEALASVEHQTVEPCSVHQPHEASLHEARNLGAKAAQGEWLCFLDADDKLDPGFVEAMDQKILEVGDVPALLQPAHRNSVTQLDGEAGVAVMRPSCDLRLGNYLMVCTVVRKSMFLDVGGFNDLELYEDWDLWIRCVRAGAQVFQVHDAIYDVTVREGSRNRAPLETQLRVAGEIRSRYVW